MIFITVFIFKCYEFPQIYGKIEIDLYFNEKSYEY